MQYQNRADACEQRHPAGGGEEELVDEVKVTSHGSLDGE